MRNGEHRSVISHLLYNSFSFEAVYDCEGFLYDVGQARLTRDCSEVCLAKPMLRLSLSSRSMNSS